MTLERLLPCILPPLLIACQRPSATEKAHAALVSWSASVQEAGRARLAGSVPPRYVVDLLDASRDALRKERSTLAEQPATAPVDSLLVTSEQLATLIDSMRERTHRDDRQALHVGLEALAALDGRLRAIPARDPPR